MQEGTSPEVTIWMGCIASLDQRARKILEALFSVLESVGLSFAVIEGELCTGDPALRAGDQATFTMMALQNIALLKELGIKKMITICPHCMNIFNDEYQELGSQVEVIHHTVFLYNLLKEGRLSPHPSKINGTYHDPCYLARAHGILAQPREILQKSGVNIKDPPRAGTRSFCCGAGGAQIFKESEPGKEEVFVERARECLSTGADAIFTACPFCNLMLRDGVKHLNREEVKVIDIVEWLADLQAKKFDEV